MSNVVFISYARADGTKFATELEEWLESNEVALPAFRDVRDIKWGDDWKKVIDSKIETCFVLIVVITKKALISPFVTYEWAYALGREKRVLPLIMDEGVTENDLHPKLKDLNWERFDNSSEDNWDRLKQRLFEIQAAEDIPPAIANAVGGLNSSLSLEREQAIESLEQMATPQADRAIRNAINHDHPDVRIKAAIAYTRRTNRSDLDVLPGLGEALKISSGNDKSQIINLLQQFNNLPAAEYLFNAIDPNDKPSNGLIVHALLAMTNPEIIPVLKQFKDTPIGFKDEIVTRLAQFKEEDVLSELVNTVCSRRNDPRPRREAMRLLLGYETSEAVIEAAWQILEALKSISDGISEEMFRQALLLLEATNNDEVMERLKASSRDTSFNRIARNEINMAIDRMRNRL